MSKFFALLAFSNLFLFGGSMMVSAVAVKDVIDVCTRWADAPLTRGEKFINLGWRLVEDKAVAALPLAHANALSDPPEINSKKDWSNRLEYQLGLQVYLDWPYVFKKDSAYVFLERLSPTVSSGAVTCVLVGAAGQELADVFSEAEALGTLEINRGVVQARISRSVMEDDANGWISVIFGLGLTEELNLPSQLASSMKLTVVNGRLR